MQPKQDLDKNTIIYLVNEITKHQGIKNVPVVKLGRLMYLLWLEYASLQPGLSFPPKSPMANMQFVNYERGPAEAISSDNYETIKNIILSGRIPTFAQTQFGAREKIHLEQAFETVRNCYSAHRTADLCCFIQYDLPTCLRKPKIWTLDMTEREFAHELRAFMRNRKKLK
jgi:hypothetical protein